MFLAVLRQLARSLVLPALLLLFALPLLAAPRDSGPAPTRTTLPNGSGLWYVKTDGSDANDCLSPATACATINAAIAKPSFVPSDTVRVAIGLYSGPSGYTPPQVTIVSPIRDAVISGGWDTSFTSQVGYSQLVGMDQRGIANYGHTLRIDHIEIKYTNSAYGSNGGAIYNEAGRLTVTNSRFLNNAGEFAPGILNTVGGYVVVSNTLFYQSITNFAPNPLVGTAIYQDGGSGVEIYNSTIHEGKVYVSDLSAAIASKNGGPIKIVNTTIARGERRDYGTGPSGIYVLNTPLSIRSSTIAHNEHGGVWAVNSPVTIENSILFDNGASDCHNEPGYPTSITSLGFNLIGANDGCTLNGSDSSSDPGLQVVTDMRDPNVPFGPGTASITYLTYAFALPGPAWNGGNPAGCTDADDKPLATDQRGRARNGRCDIGAFEAQGLELSSKTLDPVSPYVGTNLNYTIAIRNADTLTREVMVTDVLPGKVALVPGTLYAGRGIPSFSSGAVTWSGAVSGGDTVTITFGATAGRAAGWIENTATISAENEQRTVQAGANVDTRQYLPFAAVGPSPIATVIVPTPPFPPTIPPQPTSPPLCPSVYYDDFSNPNSGWALIDNSLMRTDYINGEYRIKSWQSGYFLMIKAPSCSRIDYTVTANARWDSRTGSDIGLVFGLTPWTNYYLFFINTDYGEYALLRYSSGSGYTALQDWTASSAISTGLATNLMSAVRNGSRIDLFVNQMNLGTWNDGDSGSTTYAGLIMSPYSDDPIADARFDNFEIRNIGSVAPIAPGTAPRPSTAPSRAEPQPRALPQRARPK